MRTFVELGNLIETNADLMFRLDDLEKRYDEQFKIVFEAIRQIMSVSSKKTDRLVLVGIKVIRPSIRKELARLIRKNG